jgi:hypothetical protein
MSVSFKMRTNLEPIKLLPAEVQRKAVDVIDSTALVVEGDAKLACPVDVGALRASLHTVSERVNNRDQAMAEAEALYAENAEKSGSDAKAPRAQDLDVPASAFKAFVAVGMAYGLPVETGGPHTPAQPFLVPAAMRARAYFRKEMSAALKSAAKSAGWKE